MKRFILFLSIWSMVFSFALVNVVLADSTIGSNISTTGTLSTTSTLTVTNGSATGVRFQNAAGTNLFVFDHSNTRFGANSGGTVDTTLEVGGTASISGLALFGASASVAGNFELTGTAPLFGINSGGFIDTTLEVGGTASISGQATFADDVSVSGRFELTSSTARFGLNAGGFTDTAFEVGGAASVGTNLNIGENSTATTSITFETRSTVKGTCFTLTGTNGTVYYARIVASGSTGTAPHWWVTTKDCTLGD